MNHSGGQTGPAAASGPPTSPSIGQTQEVVNVASFLLASDTSAVKVNMSFAASDLQVRALNSRGLPSKWETTTPLPPHSASPLSLRWPCSPSPQSVSPSVPSVLRLLSGSCVPTHPHAGSKLRAQFQLSEAEPLLLMFLRGLRDMEPLFFQRTAETETVGDVKTGRWESLFSYLHAIKAKRKDQLI